MRGMFPWLLATLMTATLSAQPGDAPAKQPAPELDPRFEFAVYYLQQPKGDPVADAVALITKQHPKLRTVRGAPTKVVEAPSVYVHQPDIKNYAPLSAAMLKYKSRGLSNAQKKAFLASPAVLVLTFFSSRETAFAHLDRAGRLVHDLGKAIDGVIWDEQTREIFTPSNWKKRRIDGWHKGLPNVARHITIHAFQDKDGMRAVTLGMRRFGQADLTLTGWPRSFWGHVGASINAVAQQIVETGKPFTGGPFHLDLTKLKHEQARNRQYSECADNPKRAAKLKLRKAPREEGDPLNLLLTFELRDWPGKGYAAKLARFLETLYGTEADEVTGTTHDEAIKAASRRARAKLPAKRALFIKGLPPGERFLVKAPFKTPDGTNEWMWVEVLKWPKGKIEGVLMNTPNNVPKLELGARVTVNEPDVFDYIHRKADGSFDGNETGKLIAKRQKR